MITRIGEQLNEQDVTSLEMGQAIKVKDGEAQVWVSPDSGQFVCQWVDSTGRVAAESSVDTFEDAQKEIDIIRPLWLD